VDRAERAVLNDEFVPALAPTLAQAAAGWEWSRCARLASRGRTASNCCGHRVVPRAWSRCPPKAVLDCGGNRNLILR